MPIIDASYFKGNRHIPNLSESYGNYQSTVLSNDEVLDEAIQTYEAKFLTDVFGFYEAKNILAQLDASNEVKATAEQKYKDLIDGNETLKWRGLRYEINSKKESMVADYVYANYVREQETKLTQLGNSVDQVEKSQIISSWNKYVQAWRRMHEQRQGSFHFDFLNKDEKTLLDFVRETDGFDAEHFKFYENQNNLGI